eukprot:TRINITY_DN5659_c0_g1_i1.p1 TRINITY_DN5659_c0_g1~~TRINITY_DN5659_c0_g1_i1.p1  ORF type:complete len:925 (+),score=158.16 TRINITY_DN5659_c0_g1_i1:239-3013(+)
MFATGGVGAVSVDLELLEKPRGSNGQWIPLHAQQYVRVSSKKGKNLRLVARANPTTSLHWNGARLFAVENTAAGVQRKHEPSETSTNFQIIDSRWSEGYAEFDLKIFFKNNTVHFVVEMPEHGIRAASGAIITHNSGHIDHAGKKAAAAAAAAAAANKPSSPPIPPTKPIILQSSPSMQNVSVVIKPEPIFERDSDESMDVERVLDSYSPTVSSPGSNTPESPGSAPRSPLSPNSPPKRPTPSAWVTIEKSNLDVQGDLRARRFLQYSDLQLKTEISDIVGALQFVTQLSGKKYYWRGSESQNLSQVDRRQFVLGFIAQEVQRVLPELVEETTEGYLAVKYSEFVPILIEALKQHAKEVDDWANRVETISQEFEQSHRILLDDLRSFSTHLAIPRGSSSTSTTSTSDSAPSDSDDDDNDNNSNRPIPQSPRVLQRGPQTVATTTTTNPPQTSATTPLQTPTAKRKTPKKRFAKPVMMPMYGDSDSEEDDAAADDAADEASETASVPEVVRSTSAVELTRPNSVAKLDRSRMSAFENPADAARVSNGATKQILSPDSDPIEEPEEESFFQRLRKIGRKKSKPKPDTSDAVKPPSASAAAAAAPKKKMSTLKKVLIISTVFTVLSALIAAALAVYFLVWAKPNPSIIPELPPVNPVAWRERNNFQNPGLEEDPATAPPEEREIAYWEGDFIRTQYDPLVTAKRATQPTGGSWPLVSNASLYFDSGRWGARMTIAPRNLTLNESLIYSPRYAAQVVNMTYLGLQITGGYVDPLTGQPDPTHYVCGMNVSVWVNWIYTSPLNETNPNLLNDTYDWTNQTRPTLKFEVMTLKVAQGYINPLQRYNTTRVDVDLVRGNLTDYDWHQIRAVVPIRYREWPKFLAMKMSSTFIGSVFFDLVEAKIVPCTYFDSSLGITYSSEMDRYPSVSIT